MISSIKKIKNIGLFKDYDTKATGLKKDFTKCNLIYGLNAFGKSTLCDILKDVEVNSTERIKKRLTIPCSEEKQVALLQLSNGEGTIKLENGIWENNKLEGKIAVFDSEFVLNNIFDGTKLLEDRTTKENFTQFILGDDGVSLAQEIEELKKGLSTEKARLKDYIPESQKGKTDSAIKKYAKTNISDTLEELVEAKKIEQVKIDTKKKRDKNQEQIERIKLICNQENTKTHALINKLEKASEVLGLHYEISANALTTFQNHVKDNCHNEKGVKDWIIKGINFLQHGKNCPFCGQEIENNPLMEAYDEYLSNDYLKFQSDLSEKLNQINMPINDWDIFDLSKNIRSIISEVQNIKEVCVTELLDANTIRLKELSTEIEGMEDGLKKELSMFKEKTENMISSKKVMSSVSIKLELDELLEIAKAYDIGFEKINNVIKEINIIVSKIKVDSCSNNNQIEIESNDRIREIDEKLQRVNDDENCKKWLRQCELITEKTEEINQKSHNMEENQKAYLERLFDKIDQYFRLYGGTKFKIENGNMSNRGNKKTVGITIKFQNQLVAENTDFLFSESDKRALALSVFMAKIDCINDEEKENIIVIYDDPITSFDDNRMKNVEMSILGKSREVEQTFVFTHNFNFAKTISEKYADEISCYGIDRISADCHGLYDLDAKEHFADGFTKNFGNILKFNNCESNDMSENDLRIFLEEYLAIIFAKQYEEQNINNLKLGERIDKLEELGLISNDVKLSLHDYRNELNSGSHTFKGSTIEDDRLFSIGFIDYLFDKIQMR